MEELGRIAAQTAKQILFQKVRDAVRNNVYEQYIDRVGELVNGFVKRFERGNMIVDLGNLEAILPRSQQSRGEQWNQGERIRVVITNVSKESKGPQIRFRELHRNCSSDCSRWKYLKSMTAPWS